MTVLGRRDRKSAARNYIEGRLRQADYDDLADILKGAEQDLDWAPSRSTFYQWVREWREARARDTSGQWSLATDDTGRPDVVMSVLAALIGRSRGRFVPISRAEARWMVRLATAIPAVLEDGTSYRRIDEHGVGHDPIGPAWGALRLFKWATRYVDAEARQDESALAELDGTVAMLYGDEGRHFAEAMGEEE